MKSPKKSNTERGAVAPAAPCSRSRLAKCSVCGKITKEWDSYGSLVLEEEYPRECIYVCSVPCFDVAEKKIESAEWQVPKLRKALGGYAHDISVPRFGYDAQPSQSELVNELLHSANSLLDTRENFPVY